MDFAQRRPTVPQAGRPVLQPHTGPPSTRGQFATALATVPTRSARAADTTGAVTCVFPGQATQGHIIRAAISALVPGCQVANDVVMVAWELAANACLHSRSGQPGGRFTITVHDVPGDHVYVAVRDQGSDWDGNLDTVAGWPHGLYLLQRLTATRGAVGGRDGWTVWCTIAYPSGVLLATA